MAAAGATDEGSDFRAFLRIRGQEALRFGYLLTGSVTAARSLMLGSLAELGARWRPLLREYGSPEAALWVLATTRYLRDPTADATDAGPAEAAESASYPGLSGDLGLGWEPDVGPPSVSGATTLGGLGRDEAATGWRTLRESSPAQRADVILRHWADLEMHALQEALEPPRRSVLATLRNAAALRNTPGLRTALSRVRTLAPKAEGPQPDPDTGSDVTAAEPPDPVPYDHDRALIDVRPAARPSAGPGLLDGWSFQAVFRLAERQAPELEPEFVDAVERRAVTVGQQLRRRTRLVAAAASVVLVAVVGVAAIRAEPTPAPANTGSGQGGSAALSWVEAWPGSSITHFQNTLSNGRPYVPLLFVDTETALGATLISYEEAELSLIDVRSHTARRLGMISAPIEQVHTATDGTHVAWLTHTNGDRSEPSQLWVAEVSGGQPRRLATLPAARVWGDQGLTLGLGNGRLHLVRTSGLDTPSVQISSVPLTGGALRLDLTLQGFFPVGWPWFSTVGTAGHPQVSVRNVLDDGVREGRLPAGSAFGACGRRWCVGSSQDRRAGAVLIGELDGSNRKEITVADLAVESQLPVIAGQFVLVRGPNGTTQLLDLRRGRTVRFAGAVRTVVTSGQLLGWRVTGERGARWRVVDLGPLR